MLSHRIRDLLFHLKKITPKFVFSRPSARKPLKPGFYSAIHNFTVLNTVAFFARSLDLIW